MNHTLRSLGLVGVAVASLSACGKKEEPAAKPAAKPAAPVAAPAPVEPTPPPAPPAPPPKPQPPAIAAPKGLFDCNKGERAPLAGAQAKALPFKLESCPTIPSLFGTLAWGMDVPTALKASKAKKVDGYQGAIDGELKVGKTRFKIGFNDVGHANEIYFSTKQAAVDAMTAAWGPPLEVTDTGDKLMLWFNAAKQTRVEVKPDTSEPGEYYVRYHGYVPMAALVAADGLLSKPMIGEPAAKVAELAGDLLEVESKDEAAANLAAMKLDDKTAAIAQWAGADEAKASLVLLGTATESYLNLSLRFKDGKLDQYGTLIDTMDNPAVRAEYLGELAAALGAPTAESSFEYDEPTYVFAAPGGHKVKVKGKDDLFFDVTK
jgi:hypothetical protein